MFPLSELLSTLSVKLGEQMWAFSSNSMIYLILAVIVGFVAESLLGWRLPLGIVGSIIAALLGAWILTKVVIFTGIGDLFVFGVPLFRALLGALFLVTLWYLVTYRLWRRPRPSYRQYGYSRDLRDGGAG
jgi:uncharacterized membrane protein YeaQ/YmgE (transglycosylase-associated protein family)